MCGLSKNLSQSLLPSSKLSHDLSHVSLKQPGPHLGPEIPFIQTTLPYKELCNAPFKDEQCSEILFLMEAVFEMFFYCPQWGFTFCMCDKADIISKKL